jgi:hypothetical protein
MESSEMRAFTGARPFPFGEHSWNCNNHLADLRVIFVGLVSALLLGFNEIAKVSWTIS